MIVEKLREHLHDRHERQRRPRGLHWARRLERDFVRLRDERSAVIERVAAAVGNDIWDLFVELDSCFEEIAAGGSDRLDRSR